MKRHTRFYGGNDHFMIYKSDNGTDEERKPTKGYGGNGFSAVYEFGNGTGMMRNHGSITWRNFNPGAITTFGSFAKNNSSIGNNGAFAVFPDENTGEVAVYSLLTSELYRDLTLADTIRKYAPQKDKNDTEAYIKFITDETGYSKDDIIKSLDVGRLYRAIKKKEGYIEGITESIEKLSEVYTWRTQKDGKVRKKHAEREGLVFRWDDSIDHPGEEPGCRCWAMAHEYPYVPKDKKLHPYAIRILG